jgi:hypothetical protein|tara:strand:- start:278 stop:454 length:177 start_codon:yes stop_codon:yes gene_type:complete
MQETKDVIDVAAASTGVLTMLSWLPPIASLFTIVWLGIRIYETDTVQKLIKKGRIKDE